MPNKSDAVAPRSRELPVRRVTKRGDFELVLIAASAGGIPALQNLLSKLPRDFPIPIAIVLHRTQTRTSLLARVLGRHCALPVKTAEQGEVLSPGTVYVAPARQHLVVRANRTFHLMDGRKIKYVHSSANPLFESSAYALDGRVVAVVLTGSGTDGTNGVQTVKGMGGVVLVQEPASSAYSSMPLSAIGTGAVDRVLPIDRIPTEILRLVIKQKRPAHAAPAVGSNAPIAAEIV